MSTVYINPVAARAPRGKMASGSPRGGQQQDVDDRSYDSFDEEEYDDWDEYDDEEEQFVPRQFREERDHFNRVFTDDRRPVLDVSADFVFNGGSDDEDTGVLTENFESFTLIDFTRDADRDVQPIVQVQQTQVPLINGFLIDVPRTAPAAVDPDPTLVAEVAKKDDETCCVCLVNVPDCEFVDCHHYDTGFVCRICADILVRSSTPADTCPFCRKAVTDYKVIVPVKPNHTWPDSIWSDRTWPDRTWPDSIWSD